MILSVDLAMRRYQDIGIALMSRGTSRGTSRAGAPNVDVTLVDAEHDLGLRGKPEIDALASALLALAKQHGVRIILIDGPQGWLADGSTGLHARVCERETHTPGKTGLPGIVKPRSWTGFAEFSVALFDRLGANGWPRLGPSWSGEPVAIESFPTHAWRSLGRGSLTPKSLPAKSKGPDLRPWAEQLRAHGIDALPPAISHDQLQAVVAGLAGVLMLERGIGACAVHGLPPSLEGGIWREGYIVSPRAQVPRRPPFFDLVGGFCG